MRFSSFQNPEIQPFFEKWGFGADMETQLWGVISEDVVFWKSVNMDHDQYSGDWDTKMIKMVVKSCCYLFRDVQECSTKICFWVIR